MNIHYTYKGNKRLAVVTFPFEETKGSHILLENFLRIVEPQSQIIYVITGGYPQESVFPKKITVKNIAHKPGKGPISKSFKYTQTQFLIAFNVLKIVQKVDIVIFYIGGALFPAICIVKLFRKKIVIANTGSGARAAAWIYKGNAGFGKIVSILENLGYLLSDNIVVISESMIPFLGIEKFRHKIISGIGGSPFGGTNAFIDIEQFSIKRDLKDREDIVGYIGRLSAEKGITEFVEAIPQIIKLKNKIRFLIVGEGLLMVDLKKRLEIANCLDKVYFTGVIPHDEIPQILNRMKFLVVPFS